MTDESFVFYRTWVDSINILRKIDKDLALEAYDAIVNYGLNGEIYEGNLMVQAVLPSIMQGIDNAKERYQKAVENGKKGGRPTKINGSEVVKLRNEGKTQKEIAEKLGCSERTVSRKLNEADKTRQNLNVNDNVNVNDNANGDGDVLNF